MMIRFCEFCGKIMQEAEYCSVCGCKLSQDVEEEQFNNPENPWPFTPVKDLTLRIQGQPRKIHVEGTHSLYHMWQEIHKAYMDNNVLFRMRGKDDIELAAFPAGRAREDFRLLEPGDILNCGHRHFSFYTLGDPDPELGQSTDLLEVNYHGTFDLLYCPDRDIPYLLGWFMGTAPQPRHEEGWVYDI